MKEQITPNKEASGEADYSLEAFRAKLGEKRKKYIQGGIVGNGMQEKIMYGRDFTQIGGVLAGAIYVLEANEQDRKKLLQDLRDTLRVLTDVAPKDATIDSEGQEKLFERVEKLIAG
ncbi:hypothetical protein A3C73_03425 [Candidatus Giovannonibacteria bacterium RIFCSPHIGHO2_02_FULL_44_11]|nr:MAG: hypothetical protein A3C73_03425 [Candidatus Giovannonibacteria bacterium RIFCSPHIGHO2_02_FULL_44_11]